MFRLPTEATFDPTPTAVYNPDLRSYVFVTMQDYIRQLAGTTAVGGFFSQFTTLTDVCFCTMIVYNLYKLLGFQSIFQW